MRKRLCGANPHEPHEGHARLTLTTQRRKKADPPDPESNSSGDEGAGRSDGEAPADGDDSSEPEIDEAGKEGEKLNDVGRGPLFFNAVHRLNLFPLYLGRGMFGTEILIQLLGSAFLGRHPSEFTRKQLFTISDSFGVNFTHLRRRYCVRVSSIVVCNLFKRFTPSGIDDEAISQTSYEFGKEGKHTDSRKAKKKEPAQRPMKRWKKTQWLNGDPNLFGFYRCPQRAGANCHRTF